MTHQDPMMPPIMPVDPALVTSLGVITDFIRKTTGTAPTSAELADALTRYFVLNEIRDHILMLREGGGEDAEPGDG